MDLPEGKKSKRIKMETLLVILITILVFIIFPEYKSITSAFPAVYLIVERRKRKRSWSEIGFKTSTIMSDVKSVWLWLLAVIFISPIATLFFANAMLPEFVSHVKDRLPVDVKLIVPTLIVITIGTALEEIIFRGFIQERLSWFYGSVRAIMASSILFALMHFSSGDTGIVIFDLGTIMIDSLLYGIIFLKTKNLFVSWFAHFASDLVAIVMIWLMF